ncbi:MAG: DUF1416 domain-containing protein [Solimonas sp.]
MANHQLGRPAYLNAPVYGGAQHNRELSQLGYINAPVYGGLRPNFGLNALGICSYQWGGANFIAGTVTVGGAPVTRCVRLIDSRTGLPQRQIVSGSDGSFRFDNISAVNPWTVMAIDQYGVKNAVAVDQIEAVDDDDTSGTQPGSHVSLEFDAAGASYPAGTLRLRGDGRIVAMASGSGSLPSGVLRITAMS